MRTLEEHCALASWAPKCELIKRDNFTACLQDSGTCTCGHVECAEGELWGLEHTDVIRNSADNNGGTRAVCHLTGNLGDREWLLLGPSHHETTEDNSVKLRVCSPGQEPVKLDQKPCVRVIAVCRGLFDLSELVVLDVNTHVDFKERKREGKE